jgi:hypothetical protein
MPIWHALRGRLRPRRNRGEGDTPSATAEA